MYSSRDIEYPVSGKSALRYIGMVSKRESSLSGPGVLAGILLTVTDLQEAFVRSPKLDG